VHELDVEQILGVQVDEQRDLVGALRERTAREVADLATERREAPELGRGIEDRGR
jgi:hypothetical protein